MKIFKLTLALLAIVMASAGCSDSKTYAELLTDERKAANRYLATQRVVTEIPADSIFEEGAEAPFYKMDKDGNVYMQVLKSGDRKNNKAEKDEEIYFRWMRFSLSEWASTGKIVEEGNANDMSFNSYMFRYQNYTLASSAKFGSGLQLPLDYLGVDCHVRLLIKSQYGFSDEISYVVPYVYTVRYFRSAI